MTMNKEELIKEYDEKAKTLRDEFINKLKDKPYEISYPIGYKLMWYLDDYASVTSYQYNNTAVDRVFYESGLLFDTKEEAEQFKREQTLIKKIKCWAKEQQGDWKPDWEDTSQYKFSVNYNRLTGNIWATDSTIYNSFSKIPHFKTEEIAQACVNEFGEEIKEVLC